MTTCELEADARVEDILNRADVIRMRLEAASPEIQLVQSLAPLWEEERRRAASAGAPAPRRAASPERAKPPEDDTARRARDAIRYDAPDACGCECVWMCGDGADVGSAVTQGGCRC